MNKEKLTEIICYNILMLHSRSEIKSMLFESSIINNDKEQLEVKDLIQCIENNTLIIKLLNKGRSSALSSENKEYLLEKLTSTHSGIQDTISFLNKNVITIKQFGMIANRFMNIYGNDYNMIKQLSEFIPKSKIRKIPCDKKHKDILMANLVMNNLI